ncbi:MAG: hypoxanthine-guanine phosphoribosyltransferase [Pseudomonadota bacterium]
MTPEAARAMLAEADLVCPAATIAAAVERLAEEITARAADSYPLVLTVMGGAVVFAGQILPKLPFPLECDYLHATRYGDVLGGGELRWLAEPRTPVTGRTVLVLDDILDEGITLAAIKAHLLAQGASACLLAVLAEKELGRPKPVAADFVGVKLPDRFVFGCGMDAKGAWRNLPAIYAVKGT